MLSTSAYPHTAAWADSGALSKSDNTGVNLYFPWPQAYNSDPWTDSISNIWLTAAIENGELISQTFVTDFYNAYDFIIYRNLTVLLQSIS